MRWCQLFICDLSLSYSVLCQLLLRLVSIHILPDPKLPAAFRLYLCSAIALAGPTSDSVTLPRAGALAL